MTKLHSAPWSTLLIVVSAFSTAVCFGVAVVLALSGNGYLAALSALPLALIIGCAIFTVRGYTVTDDAILVHRLLWATNLPRAGLQSARIDPAAMNGSIRLFGNGGFFSFTGFYRNKPLGTYRAFVTDLKHTVVLNFPGRNIVLSPGDPEAFVQQLEERLSSRP